ncbi:MAG TPA: uroporphyrinogen decarboxylase family protein, partial [Acidobacteriota bacterium]|nr:uroporphyrinogen decarboxylase family protein [Acidobacteriota bacterium]
EFAAMMEKLAAAAREAVRWQAEIASLSRELTELGHFCPLPLMGTGAPFDVVSDFLRGMRGAMLDMYRQPEKLLRACEMITGIMLDRIKGSPPAADFSPVFMPLHRGAHGFMSLGQFKTFYWPFLKTVCLALIEKGYTPDLFFEGDYNSRLEYIAELPAGKAIARFDQIDMARAKAIVGKTVCIAGNMPVSVLQLGTADDVKQAVRRLVDTAGRDGGYIMMPASALDEVNPENMKVWIDYTKEYGRYK